MPQSNPSTVQLWLFEEDPIKPDMDDSTVHTVRTNHGHKRDNQKVSKMTDEDRGLSQLEGDQIAPTVEKMDTGSIHVMN
ncbi:hypothetical protein OIU77_002077 [Salix suchowensis]|uniref:Uncharacterized protein n=1 Tax=Salix suchowensis TaxID=1278906 RepID=A0ABQ9B6K5_9ROSI|nr:hypothetical protein OIU77_002077 [Salix suchowensis]